MRLRLFLGFGALATLVAGALAAGGCYTHQCDAKQLPYDGGKLIALSDGTYVYETSPLSSSMEPWVAFNGQETLVVTYPQPMAKLLAGFVPVEQLAWTGTTDGASDPYDDDAGNYAIGAGENAEWQQVTNKGFMVTNASCADYVGRFVITYVPADAGEAAPAPPDASE